MTDFYILDDRVPVACPNLFTWSEWMGTNDCRVRLTELTAIFVSTVFLGIDHNHTRQLFADNSPPLLFETAIVTDDDTNIYGRCATWDEAEAMHDEAVEDAANIVRNADIIAASAVGVPRSD